MTQKTICRLCRPATPILMFMFWSSLSLVSQILLYMFSCHGCPKDVRSPLCRSISGLSQSSSASCLFLRLIPPYHPSGFMDFHKRVEPHPHICEPSFHRLMREIKTSLGTRQENANGFANLFLAVRRNRLSE